MLKVVGFALALSLAPMMALGQGVTARSMRVGAADVVKVAAFYQAAFGLKEIQKVGDPVQRESIMNFGATVEAARANTGTKVVIIARASDTPPDAVSHLIFQCVDVAATVARVTANGGRVERAPSVSATSGSTIAIVVDPAGNRIELIQPPAVAR